MSAVCGSVTSKLVLELGLVNCVGLKHMRVSNICTILILISKAEHSLLCDVI